MRRSRVRIRGVVFGSRRTAKLLWIARRAVSMAPDPGTRRSLVQAGGLIPRRGSDRMGARGATAARPLRDRSMIVGVPKEVKADEYRVAMLPVGVEELTGLGHSVLLESGAGQGSG